MQLNKTNNIDFRLFIIKYLLEEKKDHSLRDKCQNHLVFFSKIFLTDDIQLWETILIKFCSHTGQVDSTKNKN